MHVSRRTVLIAAVLLSGGLFAHALRADESPWPPQSGWQTLPAMFTEPNDAALSQVLQAGHAIIQCEAQAVERIDAQSTAEPPQLLETPIASKLAAGNDELASRKPPEIPFSLFGDPGPKRDSATIPEVPDDAFAEFENLAFWTGMVVLLAIAGSFIIKYRFPNLQNLATNGRLRKVAHLQLRPDAQLLLVEADDQRYLVALDRQGIKSLQSVSTWSELSDEAERDGFMADGGISPMLKAS